MRRHILLCAFIVALPAAASADPGPERVTVSVRVDDLNLATPAGGRTALRRLGQAAWRACGGSDGPTVVTLSRAFRRCRTEALETAIAQAAIPTISQAHAEARGPGLTLARR